MKRNGSQTEDLGGNHLKHSTADLGSLVAVRHMALRGGSKLERARVHYDPQNLDLV